MPRAMFTAAITRFLTFGSFLGVVTSVRVFTKYGDIEGFVASYPNFSFPFKSISKFLGIPFASPPIGELRFKPPKPPVSWKPSVRPAKEYGNVCFQSPKRLEFYFKRYMASVHNFTISEDCLYLDVYTPNVSLSFPVLVYIHGGAYELGTSITFTGDILALHGVVVVVIQYRLGPFGFLTTGDSAAPGNYGMLDQVEALKWVKGNIENFGGDPSKVTIFGQSAGGSSVGLHLLSPLSEGLFHQAIAESGVDLCPFAIQPVSSGLCFAKELAGKLNCPTSDHSAMVACMSEKEGHLIQEASATIQERFTDYFPWEPIVDERLLHDLPRNLRKKGKFKKVKLIIGFTSQEAASFLPYMVNSSFELWESVDNGVNPPLFKAFIRKLTHARNSGEKTADLIADAVEFMYTPWPDNSDKYALKTQLMDLIGDYLFFAPSYEVADIHSQHAPVYMYEFAHRSEKASLYPEWMGSVHYENVLYDFGIPLFPSLFSEYDAADRNVSLFIMEAYSNFIKTGDPTPQPVSGVTWERYNSSHRAYLRVDAKSKMAASFAPRRMSFWNDYHHKLTQVKFATRKYVDNCASSEFAMAASLHIAVVVISTII